MLRPRVPAAETGGNKVFTGIVAELGEIVDVSERERDARLTVRGARVTTGASHGDSIAVNGVCLTVTSVTGAEFTVDVVYETLRRSSLRGIRVGDRVNLEAATAVGDRLGGHIMQGHVDGVATVEPATDDGLYWFRLAPELSRYVVAKGSIAIDGVSLTVAALDGDRFAVALIPTTLELTTLGLRGVGEHVNIEVDVVAKYVEKLTSPYVTRLTADNGENKEVP